MVVVVVVVVVVVHDGYMATILVSCVKQYFCSSSTAKFTSPTVLLFRASTIALHEGEEKVFSHVVRVSLRQSEVL